MAGIAGSSRVEGMDVYVFCLICVVYGVASATSLLLVQRNSTLCVCVCVCVCVCGLETSTMRRSKPELSCCTTYKKTINLNMYVGTSSK